MSKITEEKWNKVEQLLKMWYPDTWEDKRYEVIEAIKDWGSSKYEDGVNDMADVAEDTVKRVIGKTEEL